MGRAEERAFERYSITRGDDTQETSGIDIQRVSDFIDGYHQAEEDLKLTWEDVKQICDIAFEEACRLQRNMKSSHIYNEKHYQEVLKRFKSYGKKEI